MLALNCGMYQSDIGRLKLDEIDLAVGQVPYNRTWPRMNANVCEHSRIPRAMRINPNKTLTFGGLTLSVSPDGAAASTERRRVAGNPEFVPGDSDILAAGERSNE
jgi:hypothetical protein